ncbi:MAG: ADP-glyceromanno-heptose 6-epimerase [Ferruginibacter sp.]
MDKKSNIIVTGAAGFIASCLVGYLNDLGYEQLLLVDEFDREDKELNLLHKKYLVRIERENLFEWLNEEKPKIDFVFHLGARTDTAEFNYAIHQHLNVEYSKRIWDYCTINKVPLIYASSAATYGDGKQGYKDDHTTIEKLLPLNPYGVSKNEFDKWMLHQEDHPPFWAGLKFFNVYGPNEYHKGRMASVIFHSYNQIKKDGVVKLFRSYKRQFKDGEQLRDFIYVKDIVKVCSWLMKDYEKIPSSIYNLGTGKARTFSDLVTSTYSALGLTTNIEFIDMPIDLRDTYQYFTEADMQKLAAAGYRDGFYSLEEGVGDYVKNYLVEKQFY